MTNALQAKSKYGFVDGSITRPLFGAQEESAWIKCNSMEERQQLIVDSKLPSIEAVTFFSNNSKANTNRKSTSSQDLSKLFCEHCKKSRHIKETCFELHGYPEWWEKGKKSSKPKAANSAQHLEKDEGNTSTVLIVGLTIEQYAQLISMLTLKRVKPLQPILQDLPMRKLIGMAEMRDGLYHFHAIKNYTAATAATQTSSVTPHDINVLDICLLIGCIFLKI
ncbi:uncharacterized protein LOC105771799 [Gossypium raimondii]|uniref:uncharacterized protein LOC105771799 n=1 Tax=Gossypium raimondii TaxID=29730 RepID=UPI00063A8DAA|nr:uncharacterized protein LOC105771799 [Gossypium raimondii]